MLRAEILAVGSELLTPLRPETNAAYLTGQLLQAGVDVGARVTVADDPGLLESAFRSALGRADVVIATGGLGPTEDDLTREAAAAALGRGLRRDAAILEALARALRALRPGDGAGQREAGRPHRGRGHAAQPAGLAPAARSSRSRGGCSCLLPGPPHEMQPMFEEQVLPAIRERARGARLRTRVLRIASMSESDVEQVVAPIYKTFTNPRTTILGAPGQVELHLTAEGPSPEAVSERLEALAAGVAGGAAGPHLQRGRPRAARGGGRPPARARPYPRRGRVLHGRPAGRAPDLRARAPAPSSSAGT